MKVSTVSVDCPNCSKSVLMTEQSQYRPFCSERCKLIDLGEWASESYSIKAEEQDEWSDDPKS